MLQWVMEVIFLNTIQSQLLTKNTYRQLFGNEQTSAKVFFDTIAKLNKDKQQEILIDLIEDGLDEFLCYYSSYPKMDQELELITNALLQKKLNKNEQEINLFLHHFQQLNHLIKKKERYRQAILTKESPVSKENCETLLAKYIIYNDITLAKYINNPLYNQTINHLLEQDQSTYLSTLDYVLLKEEQDTKKEQQRKTLKIIQKSIKKYHNLLQSNQSNKDKYQACLTLKQQLITKLSAIDLSFDLDTLELIQDLDQTLTDLKDQLEETPAVKPIFISKKEIEFVHQFCLNHQLSYDQEAITSILEENLDFPHYIRHYQEASKIESIEQKLNRLQEVKADALEANNKDHPILQKIIYLIDQEIDQELSNIFLALNEDIKRILDFALENKIELTPVEIEMIIEHYPDTPHYFSRYETILNEPDVSTRTNDLSTLKQDLLTLPTSLPIIQKLIHIIDEQIQLHRVNKEETPLSQTIIHIGNYSIIKETKEDYSISSDDFIPLLKNYSLQDQPLLRKLIFSIGYDKVYAYLTKHPQITVHELNEIIQTDRKLRLYYHDILEDIEMYFRSTFSYYITNKYDQKYQKENKQGYFYHRGYLKKAIFSDSKEHYQLIGQLNERIDSEVKLNNLQVKQEFNKFHYSVSFTTACGIMPFGWILNLFQILNYYDKAAYLMQFYQGISNQTFYSWMSSINNLRNLCAHYQSFYRLSSLKDLRSIMTKDIDQNRFDQIILSSSLFYYTIIMARIEPNQANIEDFIDNLAILFRHTGRTNPTFSLATDYSFPPNWNSILEQEKCRFIGSKLDNKNI